MKMAEAPAYASASAHSADFQNEPNYLLQNRDAGTAKGSLDRRNEIPARLGIQGKIPHFLESTLRLPVARWRC